MCESGGQFGFAMCQRVEHLGSRGTVRFSGELPGQVGTWIGVEWDDPSRGKHDGIHNGVHYFRTSHPTSGSFIRPHKLNVGISCVDAIRNRYGKKEGPTAGVDEDIIAELKKACNVPFIEMVGFDKVNFKQSQLENLKVVHLQGQPIRGAGELDELGKLCPSVVELILSNTLISDWRIIADITVQLKELNFLDISDNKLPVPSEMETQNLLSAFKSLRHLVLNNLGYTWTDILTCAKMWPNVTTLSVQANGIQELENPSFGLLSNLTSVYLQKNPIEDWTHINKLGNIVSLQVLHLGETGIKNIFFPGEETTSLFQSLKELNLQCNQIDNWSSINELCKLVSLENLQLHSNPLLEKYRAWDFTVAKIGGLKKLNGTEISTNERRGCEYDYLKFYGQEWLAAQSDPVLLRGFNQQHLRYTRLVKYHSFTTDDFATKPAIQKSRMINLRILCPRLPNMPEYQKKVPRNMNVQKLAGLVQKLINTSGCVPSLRVLSAKAPDVEVILENGMQDLSFYSVEDGDTIAVIW